MEVFRQRNVRIFPCMTISSVSELQLISPLIFECIFAQDRIHDIAQPSLPTLNKTTHNIALKSGQKVREWNKIKGYRCGNVKSLYRCVHSVQLLLSKVQQFRLSVMNHILRITDGQKRVISVICLTPSVLESRFETRSVVLTVCGWNHEHGANIQIKAPKHWELSCDADGDRFILAI